MTRDGKPLVPPTMYDKTLQRMIYTYKMRRVAYKYRYFNDKYHANHSDMVQTGPVEEGSQLADATPQIDLPQRIDAPLIVRRA
jgi:hypothetical protein